MQLEEDELLTLGTSTPEMEVRLVKALPDLRFLFFDFFSPPLKTLFSTSMASFLGVLVYLRVQCHLQKHRRVYGQEGSCTFIELFRAVLDCSF